MTRSITRLSFLFPLALLAACASNDITVLSSNVHMSKDGCLPLRTTTAQNAKGKIIGRDTKIDGSDEAVSAAKDCARNKISIAVIEQHYNAVIKPLANRAINNGDGTLMEQFGKEMRDFTNKFHSTPGALSLMASYLKADNIDLEPVFRSDLKKLITFDLYTNGKINEGSCTKLMSILEGGDPLFNIDGARAREIITEMLPNTPAVVHFKAVTGADGKKTTHKYVLVKLTLANIIENKCDSSHMVTPLLLSGLTQEQREGILFAARRDYKNNMLVANAMPPYNNGDQGIVQIAAVPE